MNPVLFIIIGVLYVGIGCQYLWLRQWYMAMVWFGYAFAQAGFILQAVK